MTVLAFVTSADEAAPLALWGARFARARQADLCLCIPRAADAVTELDELGNVQEGLDHTLAEALREAARELTPKPRLTTLAAPTRVDAALSATTALKAKLVIVGTFRTKTPKGDHPPLGTTLLELAPCDTMLLRAPLESGARCERVLVPAAGGPHARVALKLIDDLANVEPVSLTALFVEPEGGEDDEAVGDARLRRSLERAKVNPDAEHVEREVIVSDEVSATISRVAGEGYDLMLVGASERSRVRNWLFGAIPEKILAGPEGIPSSAGSPTASRSWTARSASPSSTSSRPVPRAGSTSWPSRRSPPASRRWG
jgi:nucleotide-binding universal stress UspA family protein